MVRPSGHPNPGKGYSVVDDSGVCGWIATDDLRQDDPDRFVALTRQDGTIEHVPTAALAPTADLNCYRLDRARCAQLLPGGDRGPTPDAPDQPRHESQEERVIPVIEETAEVHKRRVEGQTVHVQKLVHERVMHFEEQLDHEEVEVRRVAVNKVVDRAPEMRVDGETTIIPVLEERVVKVLVLREEIHVTRKHGQRQWHQDVPLRAEEVRVQRREESEPGPGGTRKTRPPTPGA